MRFVAGEAYEVMVRGHTMRVDQPAASGGDDSARLRRSCSWVRRVSCYGDAHQLADAECDSHGESTPRH